MKKLRSTLSFTVSGLNKSDKITGTVEELGRKQVGYGVKSNDLITAVSPGEMPVIVADIFKFRTPHFETSLFNPYLLHIICFIDIRSTRKEFQK